MWQRPHTERRPDSESNARDDKILPETRSYKPVACRCPWYFPTTVLPCLYCVYITFFKQNEPTRVSCQPSRSVAVVYRAIPLQPPEPRSPFSFLFYPRSSHHEVHFPPNFSFFHIKLSRSPVGTQLRTKRPDLKTPLLCFFPSYTSATGVATAFSFYTFATATSPGHSPGCLSS